MYCLFSDFPLIYFGDYMHLFPQCSGVSIKIGSTQSDSEKTQKITMYLDFADFQNHSEHNDVPGDGSSSVT